MEEPFRILILEDRASDAGLMEFELQEANIPFISKRVTTEADFVRSLHEFSPDLILSDYDLPQYDGSLALFWAKALCSQTPFILVTGAIDEKIAKNIINEGANGYVMKSQLHELVPAVRRSLNITCQ